MAEMFLKLEGITGESLDEAQPKSHKGEIEIHGWDWNMTNAANFKLSQKEASTKLEVQDITIHKICDNATAALAKHCALGQHIPKGTLTCRKHDGDEKVEYLIIELKNIKVKTLDWKSKGRGEEAGEIPEDVILNFEEFKIHYKVQRNKGYLAPDAAGVGEFGFNVTTHQPT